MFPARLRRGALPRISRVCFRAAWFRFQNQSISRRIFFNEEDKRFQSDDTAGDARCCAFSHQCRVRRSRAGNVGRWSVHAVRETLKPQKFAIELREDYTEFEHLSQAEAEAAAARAGSFDLLDRSFLSSVSLSYGLAENVQVGLTLGYYQAVNAREAEFDSGTGESEIAAVT